MVDLVTILFWLLPYMHTHPMLSLQQRGLDCGVAAVFESLSGQYLEWAYDVGGVKKARKIYRK